MNPIETRETVDGITYLSMSDKWVGLLHASAGNKAQFVQVVHSLGDLLHGTNKSPDAAETAVKQLDRLYETDRAVAMGLAYRQVSEPALAPDQQKLFADFFVEKAIQGDPGPRRFMSAELHDPPESFQRLTTMMLRDKHLLTDEFFVGQLSIAWNIAGDREMEQAIKDDVGMSEPLRQKRILGIAAQARGDKDFGREVDAFLADYGAPTAADIANGPVRAPQQGVMPLGRQQPGRATARAPN